MNLNPLLPKIDEIRVFTETHSIDLFFISETWLKSNVGDDQLILPGYNLERLDRRIGIHGGVCLFSNSKYKTSRLYNLECPNLEVMWVYVRPVSQDFRPPYIFAPRGEKFLGISPPQGGRKS